MNHTDLFAHRAQGMKASEIRELLKLLDQPDIISFAGGIPDPAYFPRDAFAEAMQFALTEATAGTALQYAASEGYVPLREWIAEYMSKLGVACGIDNILITAGSQQALDYLGKLYLDKNDTALVEWPTYLGALGAFNAYEPKFDRLNAGENRTETEIASDAKSQGGRVKFSYLSPDFANPTGKTLTRTERLSVLAQAEALDIAVIEDGAYQSLRYTGQDIPSLLALEMAEKGDIDLCRTVYCGSFSKTLAPGLRVGWVVAAKPVIAQMVLLKQAADLQTATINQIAVNHVARAVFDSHVAGLRKVYGARLNAMLTALEAHMPHGVTWTSPEGGMFVWVTLPTSMSGKNLLEHALMQKVAFVPGAAFYADGATTNTIRLNFSMSDEDVIDKGIARLANVIRATPTA
ncbi:MULTISPECIES: PLP-dependent aminotransferase family protein [Pacificibacter]|uniref:aminotransferase-like domain-containing protein n=1 Tax=Pacificibacter TaxID=1042323 RepID=UPI001C08230A|nr:MULTISPECIES: PLP-dependent aminotransferase family protein [Pacificibacter]MBU2936587.1 PLP-dependent aminotransferase family protein [Pacificibacter marinus]MDO6614610.1 PLP-dependent aminotransferase family protein [Pacificibacter sp. 1_MG-2023]